MRGSGENPVECWACEIGLLPEEVEQGICEDCAENIETGVWSVIDGKIVSVECRRRTNE